MLIGIDASRANRKYKSGTEWYSYYLIRELAKIDSKNQYILYTDKPLLGGLQDLTKSDNYDNLYEITKNWQKIISPHNNFKAKIIGQKIPLLWTQLSLSLELLLHPPDVLFIPAHTLPIIHPKKSVVTIHDIGYEREKEHYSDDNIVHRKNNLTKILNLFVKLATRGKYQTKVIDYLIWSTEYALKNASRIITISNFSKNELEKYYGKNEKITVIYHGCDKNLYKKINDLKKVKKILNQLGINQPYVFYVGRLEKKKNTPILVNAFFLMREKYKNIKHKLVLVGHASLGFDEVNYMIQEFNLNDEVIITGWVSENIMPYIYNGASALIFPSHYEGFGMPLLQAMATETPIAASNVASIPEVTAGSALLFDQNDKHEMAEAMGKIILDQNLKNDLISKGKERVEYFSWEKCARQTLIIIESS